ncbi:amino acid ABC transporter permease [Terrarubrum flagellatum]|uniref:amino acid ABC transporter permease n=1 Tax=Terrirubrum flagellatum TaxID=2895980 RepID=UPI00314541FC
MRYNWNWSVLFADPYFGWILSGLGWTILVSLVAWIIGLALGSVIGVMRTLPSPVARAVGATYVEVFRNVPLLVQIFLFYFVLPEVLPREMGRWLKRDLPHPELTMAIISLGLYTACRVAEQVRAGIQSAGKGLANAGLATGLTTAQLYRLILLPLAYRLTVPALTNEFLNVFKNSSLALTIGVLELTARTRAVADYTYQSIEAFTAASLIYATISFLVSFLMRRAETMAQLPGTLAARER